MRLPATPKRISRSDSSPVAPGEGLLLLEDEAIEGDRRRAHYFLRTIDQRPVEIVVSPVVVNVPSIVSPLRCADERRLHLAVALRIAVGVHRPLHDAALGVDEVDVQDLGHRVDRLVGRRRLGALGNHQDVAVGTWRRT